LTVLTAGLAAAPDCVAGADGAGAVLCASTGAVNMVAAISTAANFLNMVVSLSAPRLDAGLALVDAEYAKRR
jgi:hypothetical protein